MLKACGLREMTSSELQIYGGANGAIADMFEKIRNIIDFLGDYLPKLLNGIKDGFLGKSIS